MQRRDGENQKSRQCGGLWPYIPIFGHEVNENVSQWTCDDEMDSKRFCPCR
jgi:hypothetical protein